MTLHFAFLQDDDTPPPCPLCRHGYPHPLCSLYAAYEAQAMQIGAMRVLAGRPRDEISAFLDKKRLR